MAQHKYRGDGRPPAQTMPDAYNTPEPYKPSKELIEAVNLSMLLGRPLLLEGEAGSGKSRLARAVAYELGIPLEIWPIRSTSKAKDGLYTFDALERLYDVQSYNKDLVTPGKRDPQNLENYVTYGKLGEAFRRETSSTVVLIDELDKADLDFPNDLLNVLEEWEFTVLETGAEIQCKHKPIVIITSNKEKGNLPAPFLRRCVYYYVRFPENEDALKRIVDLHYPGEKGDDLDDKLVTTAIKRFLDIRDSNPYKKPSTSELLDWIRALHEYDITPYSATKLADTKRVPYPEVLFKMRDDFLGGIDGLQKS